MQEATPSVRPLGEVYLLAPLMKLCGCGLTSVCYETESLLLLVRIPTVC
jgi:hypothetical protein